MCLAPFAAGSVCECGAGPEQKANIPLEVIELDASGEPLVLSYRGDTNLRFGSILVQLRLTGDATVTATVPGSASNAGYLPPNSAMLTQDAPEAVISPCIEEEFPNSVYDAECPEAFELTLDVEGAEASSAPGRRLRRGRARMLSGRPFVVRIEWQSLHRPPVRVRLRRLEWRS